MDVGGELEWATGTPRQFKIPEVSSAFGSADHPAAECNRMPHPLRYRAERGLPAGVGADSPQWEEDARQEVMPAHAECGYFTIRVMQLAADGQEDLVVPNADVPLQG